LLDTATNRDIEWRSTGLRPGVSGSGSRKGAGPEAGAPVALSRCARQLLSSASPWSSAEHIPM